MVPKEILWIDLEPVDTLFFRDHRQRRAGLDNWTSSIPPSPLTLFGAIGTWLLQGSGVEIEEFRTGTSQKIQSILGKFSADLNNLEWSIAGPFRSTPGAIYFPVPASLYFRQPNEYSFLVPSQKTADGNRCTNLPVGLQPLDFARKHVHTGDDFVPSQGWLPQYELEKILSGNIPDFYVHLPDEDFSCIEERYGIGIAPDTFAAEEGMFFNTRRIRFKRHWDKKLHENMLSVQVRFSEQSVAYGGGQSFLDDILSRKGGLTFCGGERGRVNIRIRGGKPHINHPDSDSMANAGRFLLYLCTPSLFREGWKPAKWPSCFEGTTLVSVALDKSCWVSGWSNGKGPRPLLRAVPGGTIYYFETSRWDKKRYKELIDKYHFNQSISDLYSCAGYGITCIGIF
jgi:CRISPR-associated protein Cmr3